MATVKPVVQYNLNRDFHTAQVMASGLDRFVHEDAMYGFMPEGLPKLTIGGLLMRLNRLSRLSNLLSDDQRAGLRTAQQQLDSAQQEWQTAYTGKISRELAVHINEMKQFVGDCQRDLDEGREMYPSVIEKRVMAQALAENARELNTLTTETEKQLAAIDSQLQGYFKPGSFIWDQRLQPAYPQAQYGYLYVTI